MTIRAKFLWSVLAAVLGTFTLGVVLAYGVVVIAQRTRVFCTQMPFDGGMAYSCPDGIGYAFPAFTIMALTGMTCFLASMWMKFRSAPPEDQSRAAAGLMFGVGCALTVIGSFFTVISVWSPEPSARAAQMSVVLAATGIVLILMRGSERAPRMLTCVAIIVLLLGYGLYSVLNAPFMVGFAGLLGAAIVIQLGRGRKLRRAHPAEATDTNPVR